MLSLVTIDRQPGSSVVAIWVSARSGGGRVVQESDEEPDGRPRGNTLRPQNVNAVVIDLREEPDAITKVRSLTRSSVLILTPGSNLEGLPVDGEPLEISDFDALLDETELQQCRILDALDVYATRISPKTGKPLTPKVVARPDWPCGQM